MASARIRAPLHEHLGWDGWREFSRRRLNAGDGRVGRACLLDDLVRSQEHRLRDREPEGLGGLEVDDQFELGRLLDRESQRHGVADGCRR